MRHTWRGAILLIGVCFLLGLTACVAPYRPLPYVPKAAKSPQPVICHDAIGHNARNKPWILGGKCCCTPTRANYQQHVAAGTIDPNMSYEAYLKLYNEKGIVTDLVHRHCGNLCSHGPHVTLGGKCMATPTPGTWMYEQVTFGPHGGITYGQAPAASAATSKQGAPS